METSSPEPLPQILEDEIQEFERLYGFKIARTHKYVTDAQKFGNSFADVFRFNSGTLPGLERESRKLLGADSPAVVIARQKAAELAAAAGAKVAAIDAARGETARRWDVAVTALEKLRSGKEAVANAFALLRSGTEANEKQLRENIREISFPVLAVHAALVLPNARNTVAIFEAETAAVEAEYADAIENVRALATEFQISKDRLPAELT